MFSRTEKEKTLQCFGVKKGFKKATVTFIIYLSLPALLRLWVLFITLLFTFIAVNIYTMNHLISHEYQGSLFCLKDVKNGLYVSV